MVQLTAVGIAVAYAAVGTIVILVIVNKTIGLRSTVTNEMAGLDSSYHGEKGYGMLNPN
jgi:Amt family ammonium transporter